MVIILALMLAIPLGLDLYMPVPEDNPITSSKLALGRKLFHDRRLSRSGSIARTSCHDPERAFSDSRPLAVGVFGRVGRRHAPALINRGYGRSFFWDGRIATLEEQVLKPIEDSNDPRRSRQFLQRRRPDESLSRFGYPSAALHRRREAGPDSFSRIPLRDRPRGITEPQHYAGGLGFSVTMCSCLTEPAGAGIRASRSFIG